MSRSESKSSRRNTKRKDTKKLDHSSTISLRGQTNPLVTPNIAIGDTPFHEAARMDEYEECCKIIEDANQEDLTYEMIPMKNHRGQTALHYAAQNNGHQIAEAILRAARANGLFRELLETETRSGETALACAAFKNCTEVYLVLLEEASSDDSMVRDILLAKDFQGSTNLHHAAQNNNLQMASKILEIASDIGIVGELLGAKTAEGNTAFALAAVCNNMGICEAIVREARSADTLSDLLAVQNIRGHTVIAQAEYLSQHAIGANDLASMISFLRQAQTQVLIEAGVSVEALAF